MRDNGVATVACLMFTSRATEQNLEDWKSFSIPNVPATFTYHIILRGALTTIYLRSHNGARINISSKKHGVSASQKGADRRVAIFG